MVKTFDVYDNNKSKVVEGAKNPITIEGLTPNTLYSGYFVVDSGNADEAARVKLDDFKTADVVTEKPSINVSKSLGKVTYTITPPNHLGSAADHYTVYYTDGTTELSFDSKELTGNIDDLAASTAYTFAVTALNSAGESVRSEIASLTTD